MKLTKSYTIPVLCFLTAGAVTVFAFTRSNARFHDAAPPHEAPNASELVDLPVAESALRLLDVAFEAASLLPDNPHVKNKARNQEAVVDALLELGQPTRAMTRAEAMTTWRQGNAFASLALYSARNGARDEAERMISKANDCAAAVLRRSQEEQTAQGWQSDRILARVAQAMELVDRRETASAYAAALADAESSKLAIARAERVDEEGLEAELRIIDGVLAAANMETTQSALEACSRLYRRFYADPARRKELEERFSRGWKSMPLQVRIELTLELSAIAVEREDGANGLRFVDDADAAFRTVKWPNEDHVALGASIAAARFRAGGEERARADLAVLEQHFEANRDAVYDVFRGRPLRAIAEAHGVMLDSTAQRRAYEQALEEGVRNPNGRPRVDDLVATCCSMARNGFEPDAELWERIERVRASLSAPW